MNAPFNENNIETLLKRMKNDAKTVTIQENFTISVMDRIREDESSSVKYFESVYKKFLIFGSIAAAAAVILTVNVMLSYNSFASEYAMLDILNGNLF